MDIEAQQIAREGVAVGDLVKHEGWQVVVAEIELMKEEILDEKKSLMRGVPSADLATNILQLSYRYDAIEWFQERVTNLIVAGQEASERLEEEPDDMSELMV